LVSVQGLRLSGLVIGGLLVGLVLVIVDPSGGLLLACLQVNALVLHGWVWQLFTSVIVAPPDLQGVLDVGLNALSLIWLDRITSEVYSKSQYYATFLVTALFGNILSLTAGPGQVSFGASGGIFGLVAGLVTYDYAVNKQVSPQLVSWFLFIFIYSSFLLGNVNWLAHLGGAVLGFAIGYVVGRNQPSAY